MITGIDPACQFEVEGGLIVDCIPPAERPIYRLWRAAAFLPLARNAVHGKFVLNVGPLDKEKNQIHFGNSWRRAFEGATQILSERPSLSDHQDVIGASGELVTQDLKLPEQAAMLVFALDPTIDAKRDFDLQRTDGVHFVTEHDIPMSALDSYTRVNIVRAFGHLGIVMPE